MSLTTSIRITLTAGLAALGCLATAQLSFSPPSVIPGDTVIGAATNKQEKPVISRGGSGYLVVWEDHRSSLAGGPPYAYFGPHTGKMGDIYAARLDASGALIDKFPIVISDAPYNQSSPQVVWNGTNWLVAWTSEEPEYQTHQHAVRVSPAGQILDSTPIELDPTLGSNAPDNLTISTDNNNWVAFYRQRNPDNGYYVNLVGVRINGQGQRIDATPINIVSGDQYSLNEFKAIWATDQFLLAFQWESYNGDGHSRQEVWGVRLNSSLQRVVPAATRLSTDTITYGRFGLATDGNTYFLVGADLSLLGEPKVRGVRISHTLQVLDPNPLTLATLISPEVYPEVAWGGTKWIVTFDGALDGRMMSGVHMVRVNANGTLADASPKLVSEGGDYHHVGSVSANATGGAVVAFTDYSNVFASRVGEDGTIGAVNLLTWAAPRQVPTEVIPYSGGYLLMFGSATENAGRSLVQRFRFDGSAIDSEPFVIKPAEATGYQLAWNGKVFMMAYSVKQQDNTSKIFAKRLDANLNFLDANPVEIMVGYGPNVGALNDKFLITGYDNLGAHHMQLPYGVRITDAGVKLDAQRFGIAGGFITSLDIGTLGGNKWITVYNQKATHDSDRKKTAGTIIPETGSFTPASFGISPLNFNAANPEVASNAGGAVVVFEWGEDGTSNHDIWARRILNDGTMPQPQYNVSNSTGQTASTREYIPAISWDGTKFITAWLDHRRDAWPLHNVGDIFGSRLDVNGVVLDPNGVAIALDEQPESQPELGSVNGNTMLAYTRFMPSEPFANHRVNAAFIRNTGVLSSLTVSDGEVVGGESLTATVSLTAPAPVGGTVVAITDNTTVITTPANVTVPAGAKTASFVVKTDPVAATAKRLISATLNGVTKSAVETLVPGGLAFITATPSSVKGGTSTVVTVKLTGAAPAGGTVVNLSDNSSALTTPVSITIPAGASSATVTVGTTKVTATYTRFVYATLYGTTKQVGITLTP